jgi:protease II
MALIVEDGSLVANANSYITLAEYKAWADARGLTYSADDTTVEQQILRAMDYLERIEYIGNKANENQPLQWPRTEALIDGYYADATEIPKEVKTADLRGNQGTGRWL